MKYLPNKTFVSVILAIAVVGGGMFLWNRWDQGKKEPLIFEQEQNAQNIEKILAETISRQDFDNDKLPDWEEALWKTDPRNPDTDGDGAQDGEEVTLDRDPTKKGPNDAIEKNPQASTTTSGTTERSTLNETDVFMRELLGKYFALKKSGNTDSRSIEKLGGVMADEFATKGIPPAKTYSPADVMMSDNSNSSLEEYGERVGTIFMENLAKESELNILARAFETESPDELDTLDRYEKEYSVLVKKLLSVPTPPILASSHTGFLNDFESFASAVEAMQSIFKNPIRGLSGTYQYQKNLKTLEEHMKYAASTLNNRGIIFKKGDGGYVFTAFLERTR